MNVQTGLARLAHAFDGLQMQYCVCAILQPEADIELVADIGIEDAPRLAGALHQDFFADPDMRPDPRRAAGQSGSLR